MYGSHNAHILSFQTEGSLRWRVSWCDGALRNAIRTFPYTALRYSLILNAATWLTAKEYQATPKSSGTELPKMICMASRESTSCALTYAPLQFDEKGVAQRPSVSFYLCLKKDLLMSYFAQLWWAVIMPFQQFLWGWIHHHKKPSSKPSRMLLLV